MKIKLGFSILFILFLTKSLAQEDQNTICGALIKLKYEVVSIYISSDRSDETKVKYDRVVALVNGLIFDIMSESARRNSTKIYKRLDRYTRETGFAKISYNESSIAGKRIDNYLQKIVLINAAVKSLDENYANNNKSIALDASLSDGFLAIPEIYMQSREINQKKISYLNDLLKNALLMSAVDLDKKLVD
ncbi:MAG: hypothetical protein RLN79_03765 [Cytophagales bacterium]